jgi:hypothetical protein
MSACEDDPSWVYYVPVYLCIVLCSRAEPCPRGPLIFAAGGPSFGIEFVPLYLCFDLSSLAASVLSGLSVFYGRRAQHDGCRGVERGHCGGCPDV